MNGDTVKEILKRIDPRIEPVLFFGAIGLCITAYAPALVDSEAKVAAVAAVLLWLQRSFSTPTKVADAQAEGNKYVGALEHQATAIAAEVFALKAQQPAPTPPQRRRRPIDARAA